MVDQLVVKAEFGIEVIVHQRIHTPRRHFLHFGIGLKLEHPGGAENEGHPAKE